MERLGPRAEAEGASVVDGRRRSQDAALERRDRRDWLEGGPRRIKTLNGTVRQRRAVVRAGERQIGRGGNDRLREDRWVERRRRAEPQDLPVVDVHGDEGAGSAEGVERCLTGLLDRPVDREHQVVARLWLGLRQDAARRIP